MAEAIRAVGKHLAIHERHHHVDEPVVGFAEVDDVADIRMLEPHAEARLSPQTSHRVGVVRERRGKDLHRVAAAAAGLVGGGLYERHTALADLLLDAEPAVECRSDQARRGARRRPVRRHELRSVARAELRVVGIGGSAGRATGHYARTWFRPPDLARYSASSARANSSSVVSTF